jgi:integrase
VKSVSAHDRLILTELRSSGSAAHGWPKSLVQTCFKPGQSEGVWPGLTGENRCERCVINAGEIFDCSQRTFSYDQLQLFDEQPYTLSNRIGSRAGRPIPAKVGWSWSRFAWHRRRLSNRRIKQLSFTDIEPAFCHTHSRYLSVLTDTLERAAQMTKRIQNYVPKADERTWHAISAFVRAVVTEVEPHSTYDASSLLSSVTGFITWTYECGTPLDRSLIFDLWKIEEYITHGCPSLSSPSRGNRRSHLLRVAEILIGPSFTGPRLNVLGPSDPTEPYNETELDILRRWAHTRPSLTVRRDAIFLVSLGAGAGLAVEDLLRVRYTDITIDADGVTIQVPDGRRPRTIPMLNDWTEEFVAAYQLFDIVSAQTWLFRPNRVTSNKNAVTNFVTRNFDGIVRPSSQRLRATWIVAHLGAATPVVPLMKAAGVESLEALTRYVRYVPDHDPVNAVRMLRGSA